MFNYVPKARGSKLPYWDRVKLEPGKSINGWCAGPVKWAPTHWEDRATGCRKILSGGHLACRFCVAGFEVRDRGWLPFYDQHGGRMVAVFGDTFRHQVELLKRGDTLKVTKTIRQGCPIRVERFAWTVETTPLLAEDGKEIDATELMLRAWKDQTLIDWLAAHPDGPPPLPVDLPTSDKPVSLTTADSEITIRPEVVKAMNEAQAKRDQEAHAKAKADTPPPKKSRKKAPPKAEEPQTFNELFPNLAAKIAGHTNGNGKHKKGKK